MQNILKRLKKVRKGQNIRDALTADLVNGMIDAITAIVNGQHIRTGPGMVKREGGSFCILDSPDQDIPQIAESYTPFQVIQQTPQIGDGAVMVGVQPDSHVINSADKDTYEEDNSSWGMLSDTLDSGGFSIDDLEFGHKIWLQFTFDSSGNLTSIDVMHGDTSSDWSLYPDPIEINAEDPSAPYQQYYHQLIAEVTDPESDPRDGMVLTKSDSSKIQITQILFTDLELVRGRTTEDADQAFIPVMVCIPWNSPGTALDGSADPITDATPDIKTPWEFLRIPPIDFQLRGGGTLGIYSGTVSDSTPGGSVWEVSGLTTGQYTNVSVSADGYAWLVITYNESDIAPNITSVTFDTGTTVPDNESGTIYVPLGSYSWDAINSLVDVYSSPIGSQVFAAWRIWFSNPAYYGAECNPI